MNMVVELLVDLGEEDFDTKEGLAAEMDRLHGRLAYSTNGLIHQHKE